MIDLENNFYDRTSVIDLLKRRVIDLKEGYRQNIAFLGNRFIGKTSILRKFMTDLDDESIVQIYVDLDHKDFNYLFNKFAGSILYHYAKMKGLTLQDDLGLLLESTKKMIPHTVEEIKKIRNNISKGRLQEAYRDLISIPETFAYESGKFCVIILDEFHNLDELGIPNVFQELGKKIMTQKKCIYIVASSLGDVAKQILSEKLSLLFGHFEVIHVTTFDTKTSQGFMDLNLKNVQMNPTLKNFLIDLTGGHPFYMSIICQEIINLSALYDQKEVFMPLLVQAIENTIFNRWGILGRHFELTLYNLSHPKANSLVPRIMISLANGKSKIKDLTEDTGLKKIFVHQRLNRLMDLGIVDKNGNVFHFQDKLLKYWIQYVYQKRTNSIDGALDRCRELFNREIEQLVAHFQIVSKRDLSSRIIELLHCFDNEAFNINGRKYKLPSFREITPLKINNGPQRDIDAIKAQCCDGTWFIALKEDLLQEGEVNAFLAESKRQKAKLHKHVIISLGDLDANARLRALQEKIWIWNEGELNALLSLYDKPYIVK